MSNETKRIIEVIENVYHISDIEQKEKMILELIESAKKDGLRTVEFKEKVYDCFNKEIKATYKITFEGSQILAEGYSEQEHYFSKSLPIKKVNCFETVTKTNIKSFESFGCERTTYDGKVTKILNSIVTKKDRKNYLSSYSVINGEYEEICFEKEIDDIEELDEVENYNFNSIDLLKQEIEFLYGILIKTKSNTNVKRLIKYL